MRCRYCRQWLNQLHHSASPSFLTVDLFRFSVASPCNLGILKEPRHTLTSCRRSNLYGHGALHLLRITGIAVVSPVKCPVSSPISRNRVFFDGLTKGF